MESEKFNPDATCGFRMSEPYFENSVIEKLYNAAWKQFTDRAPEFIEFKFKIINLLYQTEKKASKAVWDCSLNVTARCISRKSEYSGIQPIVDK